MNEQEKKQVEQTKKTLKIIFAAICVIVIAGCMDTLHYKYKHSGYNMSFTQYLTGFYWYNEPCSTDFDKSSDFYLGF